MSKRELAWKWMKQQGCFTTSEVANAIEMDLEQCRTTINKLKKQGFIIHTHGIGVTGRAKHYTVSNDAEPRLGKGAKKGDSIKRQGKTGQQLIWNTLRINRVVSVGMVVAVTKCNSKSVSLYLNNLEKAGYLRSQKVNTKLSNKAVIGLESTWLLMLSSADKPGETGPKAPILKRGKGMQDQNNGNFYPFREKK